MRAKDAETQIAAAAADWFRQMDGGVDVYEEVTSPAGSNRADLVIVHNDFVHIVEAKTELSFDLLAQARHWAAHRFGIVWVAIPKLFRRSEGRFEAMRIAHKFYGFGVLEVSDAARIWNAPPTAVLPGDLRLKESLRPGHQTHAKAGSAGGQQFTSFRATCEALTAYVQENDDCAMLDAVHAIPHHYANDQSAANALAHWIREGKIQGVFLGWRGRLFRTARASAQSLQRRSV